MRTLIRAAVMVAAATGFCIALSQGASADVVEPSSAYQPASVGLLEEKEAAKAVEESAQADPTKAEAKEEKVDEVVEPTPAPEQVVRQAPALVSHGAVSSEPSIAHRVTHPLRVGFREIGASLGRVVGACDVGFGTGIGGPVLVFAVLSMAAPFIRRRVFATRWTADEDVPEFLFARELTPPG